MYSSYIFGRYLSPYLCNYQLWGAFYARGKNAFSRECNSIELKNKVFLCLLWADEVIYREWVLLLVGVTDFRGKLSFNMHQK